jgi:hypothetical protein
MQTKISTLHYKLLHSFCTCQMRSCSIRIRLRSDIVSAPNSIMYVSKLLLCG